jgi:transcriptional regulator with XRE-family HTH domain
MIGYSQLIVLANKSADGKRLGVKLGRYCISEGIPVKDVMEFFGVSKQTVYNWFIGETEVSKSYRPEISDFLAKVNK